MEGKKEKKGKVKKRKKMTVFQLCYKQHCFLALEKMHFTVLLINGGGVKREYIKQDHIKGCEPANGHSASMEQFRV